MIHVTYQDTGNFRDTELDGEHGDHEKFRADERHDAAANNRQEIKDCEPLEALPSFPKKLQEADRFHPFLCFPLSGASDVSMMRFHFNMVSTGDSMRSSIGKRGRRSLRFSLMMFLIRRLSEISMMLHSCIISFVVYVSDVIVHELMQERVNTVLTLDKFSFVARM